MKSFPLFYWFLATLKITAQNYLSQRCLVSDLTSSLFDIDMQGSMLGDNDDVVVECNDNGKEII